MTDRDARVVVDGINAVDATRVDDRDGIAGPSFGVVVVETSAVGTAVGAEVAPQLQHAASGETPCLLAYMWNCPHERSHAAP